jgi:hypothetical protein
MKLQKITLLSAMTVGTMVSISARSAMAQMPFPLTANTPGVSADLAASPPYTCVRNFYINPAAPNASDSNPGTLAQPWQTVYAPQGGNNGLDTARPGDCINFEPGTYVFKLHDPP